MKARFIVLSMSTMALLNLSACSYIKQYFPDKTRDYLDTSVLPPLKIPDDLSGKSSAFPAIDNNINSAQTAVENNQVGTDATPPPGASPSVAVERVKLKGGEENLLLDAPIDSSWLMVSRALEAQSVEITGRDQKEGLFTVQYAPDAKNGSTWDKMTSLFTLKKEYLLKLTEDAQQTRITVLNKERHPVSDETAVKLLTTLEEGIKAKSSTAVAIADNVPANTAQTAVASTPVSNTLSNSVSTAPIVAETAATANAVKNSAESVPTAIENRTTATESTSGSTTDTEQKIIDPQSVTVELLKQKSGEELLIGAPIDSAWRMVNKALGHQSMEVTERNQKDKVFVVQYDPEDKKPTDGSTWDEINFFFKGLQTNDKEYRLKLTENNQQTSVTVLNKEQRPVSDEAAVKLLGVLQKTIKTNLAQQK